MENRLINIALLPRELRDLTGQEPPPYPTIYREVIDGRLPAVRMRGRWYVEDAPAVAEHFGLTLRKST